MRRTFSPLVLSSRTGPFPRRIPRGAKWSRPGLAWLVASSILSPTCALAEPASASAVGAAAAAAADQLWVLVAAAFVFFMQAGFLCFEVGMVRRKNMPLTAMKNVVDWVIVSLLFFVVGFGLMFGRSALGFIGSDGFLDTWTSDAGAHPLGWTFLLFQLAFAGTAATIVSGAMAERTSFRAYLIFSGLMSAVIYPVFGHWVWGGTFFADSRPWLAGLGYIDFAGSSVVHMVGGAASFVGVLVVGPRLGRFGMNGRVVPLAPANLSWVGLGVLILWLGWWGFNGGSTLTLDDQVARIIFNTNLAGAAAGLAAYVHCAWLQRSESAEERFMGGIVGGLVAITASCHVVSPVSAMVIGAIAGVLHNHAATWMLELKADDVVGAVPVHYFCGAWGVLAVALFAPAAALPNGRLQQLGVQALGVLVCTLWAGVASWVAWQALSMTVGTRVPASEELRGLRMAEGGDDVALSS